VPDAGMDARIHILVLVVLLLSGMGVEGACLPHNHADGGLYSAECDQALVAASGSVGPLPVALPLVVSFIAISEVLSAPLTDVVVINRDTDSRAPPAPRSPIN
jgi:hypothetical protein